MATNLERQLARVRDGEIDFGQFVPATRREFRAMALYLLRRWRSPDWFTVEDVEQELYVEAWRHVWKFDPSRGVSFTKYITWNVMGAAKRELHRARGAGLHGSPDRRPSRFESNLSSFGDDGEGDALLVGLAEPAHAEDAAIAAQECRRAATSALAACASPSERYVVLAIREAGTVDGAAQVLYDDVDHRTTLRLGCEASAERFVRRHALAVAMRVEEKRQIDLT